MKIKLLSLIFTAVERLGRENKLYQGGEQQSKERRGPPFVHSSAIPNMDRGITYCKLVMLTPIKTTASQASFSWKETWESYRNPLARPKNDPNFWHNRSKIKLSSQLRKLSTLTRYIVVFTKLHTYPFSLGPSKSPARILYALKTFDLHSVQNLQQQQQISYTELSNHDELQVNSFCLNSAHVSPGWK